MDGTTGDSVEATVVVYRETKSLRRGHRNVIKQKELDTNEVTAGSIRECITAGLFDDIEVELFTHQIVVFSHAWAVKAWRFRGRITVDQYVDRGLALMLGSVLTPRGRRQIAGRRVLHGALS
jgi:TetR/AcrR family transcriptional regulator, cholesterol catabolism regulator